jgi:hypothetical protein
MGPVPDLLRGSVDADADAMLAGGIAADPNAAGQRHLANMLVEGLPQDCGN